MLFYCVPDHCLTVFGTHILIVGAKNYARLGFKRLGYRLDVYRCRDIASAPAYKYTYFLHGLFS
jgi:hypothetical protein